MDLWQERYKLLTTRERIDSNPTHRHSNCLHSIEVHDPEDSFKGKENDKGNVVEDGETLKLAEKFAAKVPKLEFSSAEIMLHLLANKQFPRQAINSVDEWIETVRKERNKSKRADSWVVHEFP